MTEFFSNGGFEDWNVAGTKPDDWVYYFYGSSTGGREDTEVRGGDYSARLDIDSENSYANLFQYPYIVLPNSTACSLSFHYLNSEAEKTAEFCLMALSGEYLQADGSWAKVSYYHELPNATEWVKYDLEFTTKSTSPAGLTHLFLLRNKTASSSQIYFDSLTFDDAIHASDGISLTDTDGIHVSEAERMDYIIDEIGLASEVTVSLSDLLDIVTDSGITITDTGGSGRDRVHDCVSVKISSAQYLASSEGKIFTYSGDYLSDDGSAIVSRWQTGVMTFADQIPRCKDSFKTVYGATLIYKDITTATDVTIYISTNGGKEWTYETKTLGTGSGKVLSATFGFIKTGEYFIVAIEHASTDKEFMWLRMELDVVPLGAFFEI